VPARFKIALDVDQLICDCLGNRLRRRHTAQFFSRGVQVKPDRSLADSQDDAGFKSGFSGGRPFQTIKLSGRYQDFLFSIVTMHPQHVSMEIVGQNTTFSPHRLIMVGPRRRLARRDNPEEGRLAASPIERDLNGCMVSAAAQGDIIIFALKFESDRFFACKLPDARVGINTMNEISRTLGDRNIDAYVVHAFEAVQIPRREEKGDPFRALGDQCAMTDEVSLKAFKHKSYATWEIPKYRPASSLRPDLNFSGPSWFPVGLRHRRFFSAGGN
jgi:hypothetical protein